MDPCFVRARFFSPEAGVPDVAPGPVQTILCFTGIGCILVEGRFFVLSEVEPQETRGSAPICMLGVSAPPPSPVRNQREKPAAVAKAKEAAAMRAFLNTPRGKGGGGPASGA